MASVFGIDFGTTNSLASYIAAGRPRDFVEEDRPHPSVVLYRGDDVIVGSEARKHLDGTEAGVVGDVVRSPKRFLLEDRTIRIGGVARQPREVIAHVLRHVAGIARAEEPSLGAEGETGEVVMTIPVRLDGRGRRVLRHAAHDAGLRVRQFVHEPLAALYAWLREQGPEAVGHYDGKLLLVFDWGGGTLDLTLCRLIDGTLVQVHNRGDQEIGGDVFDERLRRLVERKHYDEYGLSGSDLPLNTGGAARLLSECESAKIDLSRRDETIVFVLGYAGAEGAAADIEVEVTRSELEQLSSDLLDRAMESIDLLLDRTETSVADLELVLPLGGVVEMPAVRERLLEKFGQERVPTVDGADRMIARGAAWIAADEQRLRLAKPFEVLLADDAPVTLVRTDEDLPMVDATAVRQFGLFCVDPRDGFARIQLMRPMAIGATQQTDPRLPYGTLLLPVDSGAGPLFERLNLELTVDENLVVSATVSSEQTDEQATLEIHDLEFGLALG